jgi:hypothetical protein
MSKKTELVEYVFSMLGNDLRQTYLVPSQLDYLILDAIQYFEQHSSMSVQEFYASLDLVMGQSDYVLPVRARSVISIMYSANPLDIMSIDRFVADNMIMSNPSRLSGTYGTFNMLDIYLARGWLQTMRKMIVKELDFDYNELDQTLKLVTPAAASYRTMIQGYKYLFDPDDELADDSLIYTYPWIKQYVLALAWVTVGTNLKLYGDIPLPSGMKLDADFALSHGEGLIEKLQLELREVYNEPANFIIG